MDIITIKELIKNRKILYKKNIIFNIIFDVIGWRRGKILYNFCTKMIQKLLQDDVEVAINRSS